jgi:hypothetical protein
MIDAVDPGIRLYVRNKRARMAANPPAVANCGASVGGLCRSSAHTGSLAQSRGAHGRPTLSVRNIPIATANSGGWSLSQSARGGRLLA